MRQTTLAGGAVPALRAAYRQRVTEQLPQRARESGEWPVCHDHCFGRIVLDNLFEDEWYDHVDGRPAYEHLTEAELRRAVDIADRMLEEGRPAVATLNERSLRWRGLST
ncbi:MAG: hypothetical protein ABEJ79_00435 [Halolamina sp.]